MALMCAGTPTDVFAHACAATHRHAHAETDRHTRTHTHTREHTHPPKQDTNARVRGRMHVGTRASIVNTRSRSSELYDPIALEML